MRVIALMPVTDAPKTIAMYDAVTAGFIKAGWPAEQVMNAVVAIESFIYGSAYDANAPASIFAISADGTSSETFAAVVERRLRNGPANSAADSANAAFEVGLDALLRGLRPSSLPADH